MKTPSTSEAAFFRLRLVLAISLSAGALFLALAGFAQGPKTPQKPGTQWPSLADQLAQEYAGQKVQPGTALEKLIKENQDFSLLREDEKADRRGFPAWLRVWWRKGHPESEYSADDPTGGYPRALHEILEWMMTHQDLKAGPGVQDNTANDPDATVNPDLRVSGPQAAARSESDIQINYFDPTKIISASNNIAAGGAQAIYYSTNSGATWSQTLLPLTSPDTLQSDPAVDWTSDSRAWSATLGIQGNTLKMRNYVSANNGATWTLDATVSGTQTNVDKEMLWVDHSASSPFKDQMYAIWHTGNPAFMNRRTAGAGGTWLATPIQVSGAESTGTAIGGDVKTNSAGDVFGGWPTTGNSKIFVVKSTNGGTSFGPPVRVATTFDSYDIGIPSFSSRRALIYVSLGTYKTATKNNVYASWTDLSGETGCIAPANEPNTNVASTCKTRIWFARSTDGGATWSAPVKINAQSSLNDQFNQWLAVDETNGTIGIMYYDTVGDAGRKKTDVWYQSSSNDGASWSAAVKVTSAMTDETISGADSGNQYGDYNGLSGYSTMFFPSWTDRRNAAKEEIWTAKISESAVPAPNIVSAGSSISAGTCPGLPNGTIDPAQTVTVSCCVLTNGTQHTTNIVGTLQATGGVSNPSAPQTYGAVIAGGASVCRTFTFTPSGACGSTVTATLQLQDGTTNLGNLTYTFTLGVPNTVFTENFDSVTAPALPSGWVATNTAGVAPLWVTSATSPDTAPNDAFVDDPATVSDKALDSAPIAITSASARLTFRNSYNLESSFDGGVLEISSPSINGGAFTDITDAAVGGSFVSGGYVATIGGVSSNPLAGRQVWSGNSGGYITTVANLGPNVAGRTIKLRFRLGSDSSVAAPGWRIDTLAIQDGSSCSPVPVMAVSRKSHAGTTFDLPLALNGTSTVESRTGGANGDHQIVITFANPIAASAASVITGSGSVSSLAVSGSTATVNLTGITDAQVVTIRLDGVNDGTGSGCVNLSMAALLGDTNGDRIVNSGDALQTRLRSGQATDGTNFRSDVNLDGFVNSGDTTLVRARSGTAVP
ncbi:MAG: hypothetical protein M3Z22_06180 [Verrucomicrobiota bacterium]|nr:hypothetical protein [Verrucomicrobiota bacterium]